MFRLHLLAAVSVVPVMLLPSAAALGGTSMEERASRKQSNNIQLVYQTNQRRPTRVVRPPAVRPRMQHTMKHLERVRQSSQRSNAQSQHVTSRHQPSQLRHVQEQRAKLQAEQQRHAEQ